MRPILLAAALALLAGPAFAQDAPAPGKPDRGEMQKRPNLRDAVTAPLDDLNLKHIDIPDVLGTDDREAHRQILGNLGW